MQLTLFIQSLQTYLVSILIQNTICGMQNRISGIIRQLLIMLMDYIQPQTIRKWLRGHTIQFPQIKIDGLIRIHLSCLDLR